MKKILFILASVLLLAACEKQSELVTVMSIDNVDWEHEAVESGTSLHILVKAESQSSTVNHITLISSDMQYSDVIVLDSAIAYPAKKAEVSYYYKLPYYTADTTIVKLTARAYDQKGNTMSYSVTFRVKGKKMTLRSIDMITMYSAASEGKSAFSLVTCQPVYLGPNDSASVAFYDLLNEDPLTPDVPSCSWYSGSGLLFTRSEGFNFSEATVSSLPDKNAWKQDYVKSSFIKNLKADDVLLFGKDQPAGVIKIISIHDEPGTTNDRYVFSMKLVP